MVQSRFYITSDVLLSHSYKKAVVSMLSEKREGSIFQFYCDSVFSPQPPTYCRGGRERDRRRQREEREKWRKGERRGPNTSSQPNPPVFLPTRPSSWYCRQDPDTPTSSQSPRQLFVFMSQVTPEIDPSHTTKPSCFTLTLDLQPQTHRSFIDVLDTSLINCICIQQAFFQP